MSKQPMSNRQMSKRQTEVLDFLYQVRAIRDLCTYKPQWYVIVKIDRKRQTVFIQAENKDGVCSVTGEPSPWKGRKHYLSEWMCKQEIVGAIFDALKTAEMHEVHEWFRYRGRSIYNPHLDPDALAEVASRKYNFNTRPDSMVKA